MQDQFKPEDPGTPGQPDQRVEVKLRTAYSKAVTAINEDAKPVTELLEVKYALLKAAETDRVGSDASFAKFLYNNMLVESLLTVRSENTSVSHLPLLLLTFMTRLWCGSANINLTITSLQSIP